MEIKVLINALNNLHSDRAYDICRKKILTYSHSKNINTIQMQLKEWHSAGYLQVIKPIGECKELDICVHLLTRIPTQPANFNC